MVGGLASLRGTRPIPVVHERLYGDVAPIVIMISAAGGAVCLIAYPVADACQSVGHCGKPGEEFFSPFGTKIEMTGLGTPGALPSIRCRPIFPHGCHDVVALEIADEAVRPDPDDRKISKEAGGPLTWLLRR
jgi:hypothetical protein